ncbi:MAG: AAA family ATPase [Clostridium sp.]
MEFEKNLQQLLIQAYNFAKENMHEFVTPEHFLYVALEDELLSTGIVKSGGDINALSGYLENYLEENMDIIIDGDPEESIMFKTLFLYASRQSIASGRSEVELSHCIATIYNMEDCYAAYFLQEAKVDKSELLYFLTHSVEGEKIQETSESFIEKYTQNLTELRKEEGKEPLIGRKDIIDRTIQILCRKHKNNPIHVGEPGVGKTTIILGLCDLINEGKIPNKLKGAEVLAIDLGGMLAGTKYRGDFEERMKNLLDEIKKMENPIVYIDEIHNIVGAGALSAGSLDASNLLKPYLMEGKIKFVGATTFEEYKKFFEKDKGLTRRFQQIKVEEPTINETLEILRGLKESYEEYHKVKYTDKALEEAVVLSNKYINDKFLPDKAIDVLDEAGALYSMNESGKNVITEKEVEEVISKICKIPKTTVEKDEKDKLKGLEERLKGRVFGQDKAIEDVVRAIKISRAGLNDDNKPVASLLFVGPTGVGKTEIAKSLSKELNIELIRFDMSEYSEKHAASKLIGAPPGYVGYEEGGLLTDAIRKQPNAVLLLDEIEKAHEDILNVLLGVMDYATLSDNKGRKADFRNTIIIMTSNAGAKNIGKNLVGFGEREIKGESIMEEVKKVFTPEFRNRLNDVVVFNHVDDKMAINIAKLKLVEFKEKLKIKNINLTVSNECVEYVAKIGISRQYGAREIIRVIDNKIKPIFIDEMLFGNLKNGGECTLVYKDGKFSLEYGK